MHGLIEFPSRYIVMVTRMTTSALLYRGYTPRAAPGVFARGGGVVALASCAPAQHALDVRCG
jgi:hypothetical protein